MDFMSTEPIYLDQVAEHFGVAIRTVHSWIRRKNRPLQSWKVGGRVFTTREAISRFVKPNQLDAPESLPGPRAAASASKADLDRRDENSRRIRELYGRKH